MGIGFIIPEPDWGITPAHVDPSEWYEDDDDED